IPRHSWRLGGGSWYGNDTVWRTVLDINRAFLYHDPQKRRLDPAAPPRRRYLAILDGIVAGHRESPLAPSPLPAGLLMGAFNPLALDAVATAMMGLDVRKVPQISRAFALSSFPLAAFELEDIRILSDLGIATIGDIYRNGAYLRS